MKRRLKQRPEPWLLLLSIASCVSYEPQDMTLEQVATETSHCVGGRLSFPEAVAMALRQNPELQSMEAAARAAGADVPATELQAAWDGSDDMLAIMVDPIAILRLGSRGAAATLAEARGAEAVAALAVARWRIVAELAEVYAVATAIRELDVPSIEVDPEAFARAGLASPTAAVQVRATAAGAQAERLTLGAEQASLDAALRRLLGLPPASVVEAVPVAKEFPPLPPADDVNVLRRPDLALALARYRVADAEFRRAVAEQYPALMLGPDIPLRGGALDAMALLRLPLGASAPARSAKERRTAARASVFEAFLAASHAASVSESDHAAAEQRAAAMVASARASRSALLVAEASLHVELDVFERWAEKAQMALRDTAERREALIAAAKARVRRAVAYGWPVGEVR